MIENTIQSGGRLQMSFITHSLTSVVTMQHTKVCGPVVNTMFALKPLGGTVPLRFP